MIVQHQTLVGVDLELVRRNRFGGVAIEVPINLLGQVNRGRCIAVGFQFNRKLVIDWGATIVAINTKDRSGTLNNVVLNCEELEGYQACNAYFGSTIGRYSNRIANGQFVLDGQQHSLSLNDDDHHMHGGSQGFDKQIWSTEEIVDADSVGCLLYTSPSPRDRTRSRMPSSA